MMIRGSHWIRARRLLFWFTILGNFMVWSAGWKLMKARRGFRFRVSSGSLFFVKKKLFVLQFEFHSWQMMGMVASRLDVNVIFRTFCFFLFAYGVCEAWWRKQFHVFWFRSKKMVDLARLSIGSILGGTMFLVCSLWPWMLAVVERILVFVETRSRWRRWHCSWCRY